MKQTNNISEKTLKAWGDMFGEGENIEPNDADLEMEKFRKEWKSIQVRAFDGYMIYSTPVPVSDAAKANRLIRELNLKLFAEPSMIRNQMTIEYVK